jgi:hypothetical protein
MTVFENITLKPKSSSSTNKFQKNERKNYIPVNKEDSPQIIKMCCSSLRKIDFMVKNIHKRWSIID